MAAPRTIFAIIVATFSVKGTTAPAMDTSMRRLGTFLLPLISLGAAAAACSGERSSFDAPAPETYFPGADASDVQARACSPGPDTDLDGDGFTPAGGDCDDCDRNANPGAFDVGGNGRDEDCNGVPDDEPLACDGDLVLDSVDPLDGVRALGLCRRTTSDATGRSRTWGVVGARYVLPDRSPAREPRSHGLLPDLGPYFKPFEGTRMLALSSGFARRPGDLSPEEWKTTDKKYTHAAPPGFPHSPPACPGMAGGQPHDGAGLELTVRVPTNARSFTFTHAFLTLEYPEYYCSNYNDVYVVLMTPKITRDSNIAFDRNGNTVSVNSVLLENCVPAMGMPVPCTNGPKHLQGTGFGNDSPDGQNHGATSWLTTTAPVLPGTEITLLFAMWDSADGNLDSTILVDDFRWSVEEAAADPVTRVR